MATLVVQRGHVPRTTGAVGAPGEQVFARAAAARVEVHVRALGHQVRVVDADPPAALYRGDLFVALHYDSSSNPAAQGASVGYQTDEGRAFAEAWKRHYELNGWTGGFRGDNYTRALAGYYGVRRAIDQGNRRAIITEAGFHSNRDDAALLAGPHGPDRVGRAVAAALIDLLGCRCPPGTPTPATAPGRPAPRPYPGPAAMGATGGAVRVWQQLLVERGYRIAIDGVFGPATNHVLVDWQRRHGLAPDGIAGPGTWHSLLYA